MALADRPQHEQAAMAYCGPRGIPLSVFLGRVVYPGDPQWLPDDLTAALEWLADQQSRCDGCGQRFADTVGKEHFDKWTAHLTGTCDGCRALDRAARNLSGTEDVTPPQVGARFRLERDKEEA